MALRGSNSIVGKWKADDGSAIIEFKSDGTCSTEIGGFTITGTYTTSGGKITTVSKNPDGTTATETDDYSISGNQLTVTTTVGTMTKTLKFTRQ